MATLSLTLFGAFKARLDGEPLENIGSLKNQVLLIYLLVERQRPQRREALFTLLWPGMPERSARHNLRQTLYALGKQFPDLSAGEAGEPVPLLLADRQTVRLNPEAAIESDVQTLDVLRSETRSHTHPSLGECRTCVDALKRLVDLYRGEFLADFYLEDSREFEEWAAATRIAYRDEVLESLRTLADIAMEDGDYERAGAYIDRQLAIDVLVESAQRQRMQALALSGRRVEALRRYRRYVDLLQAELGVEPSQETRALYERIQSSELTSSPALPETETEPGQPNEITQTPNNLPVQPTPFVGRERELAELEDLLADTDVRLVTIVGPGGMGKTRLALAAAQHSLRTRQYPDGIFFVDLSTLNESGQIPLAVVEALEIQLSGGDEKGSSPKQGLIDFLADKALLLILDNFEHMQEGSGMVTEMLAEAPGVQILATSRERLHLQNEQLYPLAGLEYRHRAAGFPGEDGDDSAEHGAEQLFLSAARRVRPDFKLAPDDRAHLRRICELVGGMPLALELAAGWVELLPLEGIAAEIERSLGVLDSEMRDIPERHRSMQAIFESTWSRLESEERDVMQKLSVFRGGFTRRAAEDVAGVSLRDLARLSGKSLLQADPARQRYWSHELLRQYALERLQDSGELQATRTAHSSYYLDMLAVEEAQIKGGREQKRALDAVEADFANIRIAWEWAVQQDDRKSIENSLEALFWVCLFRNREFDGVELFWTAEAEIDFTSARFSDLFWRRIAVRRIIMARTAWVFGYSGTNQEVAAMLNMARSGSDQAETALALYLCGWFDVRENRFSKAVKYWEEARSIYQRLGDTYYVYWFQGTIAWAYLELGQPQKRIELVKEQLTFASERGDRLTAADARAVIGFHHEMAGRYPDAEKVYRETLPVFREFGDRWHTSEYSILLAGLVFLRGDFTGAGERVARALTLARKYNLINEKIRASGIQAMIFNAQVRYDESIIQCEEIPDGWRGQLVAAFHYPRGMMYAHCGLGEFERARIHLCKALDAAKFYKATGYLVQCLPGAALIAAGGDRLERAAELLALGFHHPAAATGWLEKFPLVVRLRQRLETELAEDVYAAAWERGKALDLEETIEDILQE